MAFHTLLACANNTFFQPDEYWQSLEVAHVYVFGYGYKTWEWRWRNAPSLEGITSWGELWRLSSGSTSTPGRWRSALSYLQSGPLRSAVHPFLFVPLYRLLALLHLDDTFLCVLAPRILQGALSALAAHSAFLLARRIASPAAARAALFSTLVSPYYLYTATRTLSNTAEASFCTVGMMYWFEARYTETGAQQRQREGDPRGVTPNHAKALALAAVACLIRPTNAVIWVWLFGREVLDLLTVRGRTGGTLSARLLAVGSLVSLAALIAALALTSAALLDTHLHGRPNLPVIPFIAQNILASISTFYGANSSHWYLSQGLPVVLMLALPAALCGAGKMWSARGQQREIVLLTGWTLAVYSALAHKEWRFLQPVVPLLHLMVGVELAPYFQEGRGWLPGRTKPKPRKPPRRRVSSLLRRLTSLSPPPQYLLLTLPLALYLVALHGIGQGLTLPRYVRAQAARGRLQSLGVVMPCHSTPWQSHFHLAALEKDEGGEDRAWFITCEPPDPSRGDDPATYKDESDYFYEDPVGFLSGTFGSASTASFSVSAPEGEAEAEEGGKFQPRRRPRPSHLVVFDALLTHAEYGAAVREFLQCEGYDEERRIWNSLAHDDPRRRGEIVVFVRR